VKVELAPRAIREAERCARWWRENRPAAPTLFEEELRLVSSRREVALPSLVVWGAASLLLVVLVPTTKCPVCDEWILAWAWRQRRPFTALRALDACPNCGARSKTDKLGGA